MPKIRKAISQSVRFNIFKRDNFTCQYCGAHPPQVILHVDHITPVAKGGGNETDNLVTSCQQCNSGKGATSLDEIPKTLQQKATEIAEREAQLRGYSQAIQAKRDRVESESWVIADLFKKDSSTNGMRRDWFLSIKRFIERLGYHEVYDAMDIANAKIPWGNKKAFLYFCGICWNKIREQEKNG